MATNGEIEERLLKLLRETGALLEGHFLLSSGLHSSHYLQCALLLMHPKYAAFVGEELGKLLKRWKPEVIVSPALGAIIVGHEVARYLDIPFIFCERDGGALRLRRFPYPEGKRFAVVEDVITTGFSALEVGTLIKKRGGIWVQTACIIDRSDGQHCLSNDPVSLIKMSLPIFRPERCPLCEKGIPIRKPGSRGLA
ncbi:MAG: orotate phosphoribosyltransferase [Synergistetes bacterium]|nr:orotate phosphoribosyltransferase [Synergistota bacterium]